MSDETALLAAIAEHPAERTPLLMLADWLDEHGNDLDKCGATWLRTWCEERTCSIDDFAAIATRELIVASVLRHHGWRLFDALGVDGILLSVDELSGSLDGTRRFLVAGSADVRRILLAPGLPVLREPHPLMHGLIVTQLDAECVSEAVSDTRWIVRVNYARASDHPTGLAGPSAP